VGAQIGAATLNSGKERAVPIRQCMDGERFDPETMRVMGLAFEIAGATAGIRNRGVDGVIAAAIIERARAGERPER
jgi:hypothetical protein